MLNMITKMRYTVELGPSFAAGLFTNRLFSLLNIFTAHRSGFEPCGHKPFVI
jgi:hypothetical protein